MGNFTRRAIAFVLGMVVGIVTLFGGMAGAMYWAFKNLSLSKIGVMQEDESGLKDATIEELVALIVMAQTDPESFTVQKLEEQGIDLIKLLQGAGVDLSKADEIDYNTIKEISPILLFSKNGLNEISFSTVFALLPKGEDGVYPVFSAGARNMLRGYSLGYLLANDETTGQLRLFSEISGLKIGSLFPKTFTESYSEEKCEYVYTAENSALEKLGNLKLSLITNNVSGDSEFDIGYELNEGELKDIGSTYLVDFLADLISGGDEEARSETVKTLSLFDGVLVKELFKFNDDGDVYEFNAEVLLAGFSIGKFMGYTKCTESETCPIHENVLECNGAWYEKCTESETCPVHGNSGCAGKENEYKEYAGDTAEGLITKNLIDISIEDLFAGGLEVTSFVKDIYLGHSLGYKIASSEDGTTIPSDYCDKSCSLSEDHEHEYYWVNDADEFVGTLYNDFANISLESAMSGGINLEGIIEGSCLGELLGKYRKDGVWYDDSACTIPTAKETAMEKILLSIYDKNIDDFSSGTLKLEELLDGIKLGELMGYTIGEEDGFCNADCTEDHDHNYYWLDGTTAIELSSLNRELYNLDVSELILGNIKIDETFNDLPLGELLGKYKNGDGWYDDANFETKTKNESAMDKIMLVIYNKTIDDFKTGSLQLDELLDGIKLGELMGYTYDGTVWKNADGVVQNFTKFDKTLYETEVSSLVGGTDFKTILGGLYVGELMGNTYDGGVWKDKDGSPLTLDVLNKTIYEIEVSALLNNDVVFKDKLGHIYVGELMGYTIGENDAYCDANCTNEDEDHEHKFYWLDENENEVSNLNCVMADVKLEEIFNGKFDLKSKIDYLTLGDVITIDEDTPKILQMLEDSKIKELSQNINKMYLGELMGYTIGENDAYCDANCTNEDEDHEHKFYWLDGTEPVSKLNCVMADVKLEEIFNGSFNLQSKVNTLTLGDVITIDEDDPKILQMLEGSEINELSQDINNMYLGKVMGYTKCTESETCPVHSGGDGCTGKWHRENGTEVDGLNAKIANYTFETFASTGFVTDDFTLGDVIKDDDQYDEEGIFSLLYVDEIDDDGDGIIEEGDYAEITGNDAVEKRKNIPISQVSVRMKAGVTNATLAQLIKCGVLDLSSVENKLNDNLGYTWTSYTLQEFITTVINLIP